MTDISKSKNLLTTTRALPTTVTRRVGLFVATLTIIAISLALALSFNRIALDDPIFLDSTLGELAVWMTGQAEENAPESFLGQVAKQRRDTLGAEQFDETVLLQDMKTILVVWAGIVTLLAVFSGAGLAMNIRGHRIGFVATLFGLNGLLFVIPPSAGNHTVSMILVGVSLIGLVLLLSKRQVERFIGFIVVLAAFTVIWETGKAFAAQINYQVAVPVAAWEYQKFADLDAAVLALQSSEIDVVLADRNAVDELMPIFPEEAPDADATPLTYTDMRYLSRFERAGSRFGQPVTPELPGRVALVTTDTTAPNIQALDQLEDMTVGVVTGSFADEKFLALEREVVIWDMKISNDLNLPHLQHIAEALLQPARRNGPLLLVSILFEAALYTWYEAILGFVFGALLGFILGAVFTHVALLQRSLLPYVIASQTIPIIALAPMIVIWLRDTNPILPVAVISAYLTFFPVTINTLRGLQSPDAMSFDLMQSYAASKWDIMWKLRFPAALPYIFTALKVSATASVVGAIIGELPSGIRNGLGRAILDFSSDYSLISTPKLWAAIFIASLLGITFFLIVTVLEMVIVRGQGESTS